MTECRLFLGPVFLLWVVAAWSVGALAVAAVVPITMCLSEVLTLPGLISWPMVLVQLSMVS